MLTGLEIQRVVPGQGAGDARSWLLSGDVVDVQLLTARAENRPENDGDLRVQGPSSSYVSLYIVWQGLARMTGGSRSSYHSRDMWRRRFYWRSRWVESAFNKDGAGACLANPLRSWPRLGCTESTAPGAALEESGSPVSSGASATSFPELAGTAGTSRQDGPR